MEEYSNGFVCILCDGVVDLGRCYGCNNNRSLVQSFDGCGECRDISVPKNIPDCDTKTVDICGVQGGNNTCPTGRQNMNAPVAKIVNGNLVIESAAASNARIFYLIIAGGAVKNVLTSRQAIPRSSEYTGPVSLAGISGTTAVLKTFAIGDNVNDSPVTYAVMQLSTPAVKSTGLPVFAIVGIVLGSIALIALIFGVMIWRRRRAAKEGAAERKYTEKRTLNSMLPPDSSVVPVYNVGSVRSETGASVEYVDDSINAYSSIEKIRGANYRPHVGKKFRVAYTYEANNWDELPVLPGDIVIVMEKEGTYHEKENDQWWLCKSERLPDRIGIVPVNFLEGFDDAGEPVPLSELKSQSYKKKSVNSQRDSYASRSSYRPNRSSRPPDSSMYSTFTSQFYSKT